MNNIKLEIFNQLVFDNYPNIILVQPIPMVVRVLCSSSSVKFFLNSVNNNLIKKTSPILIEIESLQKLPVSQSKF